ncbi:MAG: hypothetical protein DRN00_03590 [Thermoplasmata archaeon]|nr:MAG: hypothetical protein DRN00_03590 [Thermoplasmata archaeon]
MRGVALVISVLLIFSMLKLTTPGKGLSMHIGGETNRVIIKFKKGLDVKKLAHLPFLIRVCKGKLSPLLSKLKKIFSRVSLPENLFVLSSKSKMDATRLSRLCKLLLGDKVEYVEPDYTFKLLEEESIVFRIPQGGGGNLCDEPSTNTTGGFPNDPLFKYQWHLHGVEEGGIDVVRAWNISTGKGVTVAVLDTGVKWFEGEWKGHPDGPEDLSPTKLVRGYDFVNDEPYFFADSGHGVHVAGTIAQDTNNGKGVCGVAPDAKIIPVKVLDDRGIGYVSNIVRGIYYATLIGADIISMSFGGRKPSEALEEALRYAYENGVTLVAAAGNDGSRNPLYPAKYPFVISVGATTYEKKLAPYSSFGPEIDVVAPGGDLHADKNEDGYPDGILQETFIVLQHVSWNYKSKDKVNITAYWYSIEWCYCFKEGTSVACPHVTGVAALLYSMGIRDPRRVKERICETAIDLGPRGRDDTYGWGLVNAYRAVEAPFKPKIAWPDGAENIPLNVTLKVYVEDPQGDKLNVKFYGYRVSREKKEDFSLRREKERSLIHLIGVAKDVPSGSWVSMEWRNLSGNSFYTWFVEVNDSKVEITSDRFTFKTMSVNNPPYTPSDPFPPDGATNVSIAPILKWRGGDPDKGDKVFYDIYLGPSVPPPKVAQNVPFTTYDPGLLEPGKTYYWRVVAKDSHGSEAVGPIWTFTTRKESPQLAVFVIPIGFGKVSMVVWNKGKVDANNLCWFIHVRGGINGMIKLNYSGEIDRIESGEKVLISTDRTIRGLGFMDLYITISLDGKMYQLKYRGIVIWKLVVVFTFVKPSDGLPLSKSPP